MQYFLLLAPISQYIPFFLELSKLQSINFLETSVWLLIEKYLTKRIKIK